MAKWDPRARVVKDGNSRWQVRVGRPLYGEFAHRDRGPTVRAYRSSRGLVDHYRWT